MNLAAAKLKAQWLAVLLVGLATLLLQVVLARWLGPAEFGIYSVAMAISSIALVLQGGGFRALLLRESARSTPGFPRPDRIHAMAVGYVILSTVAVIILAAAGGALLQMSLLLPVVLALAINAPRIAGLLVSARLLAAGSLVEEARWQSLSRVLPLVAGALAAFVGLGLTSVLLVMLIAQAAVLANRPSDAAPPAIEFAADRGTMKAVLGLALLDLATQLYTRQGTVLLYGANAGLEDIGRLGMLQRLFEAYTMMLGPLVVLFHNRARQDGVTAGATLRLAAVVVTGAIVLSAAGFLVNSLAGEEILALVLGDKYRSSVELVPWFLLAAAIIAPNMLLSQALIACNREWSYTLLAGLMVPLNLALNIWLVPRHGTKGTVIAMVVTEAVLGLAMLRKLRKS